MGRVEHKSYDHGTDTFYNDGVGADGVWDECTHIDHSDKGVSDSGDAHVVISVDGEGNISSDFGD